MNKTSDDSGLLTYVRNRIKTVSIHIFSIVIDSIFLSIWVVLQYGVNQLVLNNFFLSGIDKWMLLSFQIIFSFSTIIPILIFLYVDLRVMLIKAQRQIDDEIRYNPSGDHID